MSNATSVRRELSEKVEKQIVEAGKRKIRQAMEDPELINTLRERVCQIANEIIISNPEWKKIRKDEHGNTINHSFLDSTNWKVKVKKEDLMYEFINITPPSRSIFNNDKFGMESKYDYDPGKDPYNGAILSVWIDEGLWFDASKIFKEMARSDGNGKIRADHQSMQRHSIPFLDTTYEKIIEDEFIKNVIIDIANKKT